MMNIASSTSVSRPWHTCYTPIPKHAFTINKNFKSSSITNNPHLYYPTLYATTNSCNKEQEETHQNHQNPKIILDFYSTSETQNSYFYEDTDDYKIESVFQFGISSIMNWWSKLKAVVGQRINLEGLTCAVGILAKDNHLLIPHVSVPDIRYIDWGELRRRGFEGVVFDKDNTLTIPYSLNLWDPLGSSIEQCKSLFGNNVAIYSNSAGLHQYDPDSKKAKAIEASIGIKVIRHRVKKPGGKAEDIERQFGCKSVKVIMVGDRPFTDIVYGNRNGFLSILTKPLSIAEESFIVKQVRIIEVALINRWTKKGIKANTHQLLQNPEQCVNKDQSL